MTRRAREVSVSLWHGRLGEATWSDPCAGRYTGTASTFRVQPEALEGPVPLGGPSSKSVPPPGRDPLIRFSQYSERFAQRSKHGNKAAAGGPRLLTPGSRPLFALNGAARRLARG